MIQFFIFFFSLYFFIIKVEGEKKKKNRVRVLIWSLSLGLFICRSDFSFTPPQINKQTKQTQPWVRQTGGNDHKNDGVRFAEFLFPSRTAGFVGWTVCCAYFYWALFLASQIKHLRIHLLPRKLFILILNKIIIC